MVLPKCRGGVTTQSSKPKCPGTELRQDLVRLEKGRLAAQCGEYWMFG